MAQCECKVFVKEISQKFAHSEVGPTAMDEQQPFQVAELSHGEITGQHGLHALLTTDADTNVRHCRQMENTLRNCTRS